MHWFHANINFIYNTKVQDSQRQRDRVCVLLKTNCRQAVSPLLYRQHPLFSSSTPSPRNAFHSGYSRVNRYIGKLQYWATDMVFSERWNVDLHFSSKMKINFQLISWENLALASITSFFLIVCAFALVICKRYSG